MRIDILTLFPEMFEGVITSSIAKRAIEKEIIEVHIHDFRENSSKANKRVDDYSYGGGAGMIIEIQPVLDCLRTIPNWEKAHKIITTPVAHTYKQSKAVALSRLDHIIIICGHYEGIDSRIMNFVDEGISIGDYILTGGEIPSMIVADSIIRLLDGAIKNESTLEESFENGLLEYPQFTTPRVFEGYEVPDILFSGNHKAIKEYRFKQSVSKTLSVRPELIDVANFNKQELKWFNDLENDSKLQEAIVKAKKFMK